MSSIFYSEVRNLRIHRSYVVPIIFAMQWHSGQQGVSKNLQLDVSFGDDNETMRCLFYELIWNNFPSDSFRRVDLCMKSLYPLGLGEKISAYDERNRVSVYGKIWLDLDQPEKNCGMMLSPVPFGMDGKPQLPDTPGLREMISRIAAKPMPNFYGKLDILLQQISAATQDFHLDWVETDKIVLELMRLEVVSIDAKNHCSNVMPPGQIIELFGEQLPPYPG